MIGDRLDNDTCDACAETNVTVTEVSIDKVTCWLCDTCRVVEDEDEL